MKKIISLVLIIAVCCLYFCGCGGKENDVVGKWYDSKNKCLDIRKDGTWKLEGSYGTGTWKILDDKTTIEFIDYYGDTQESPIKNDKLGNYIDFGNYGDFYKNSYPSVSNAKEIDYFENVKIDITGISPFCKVKIDNSNCPDLLKERVSYNVDEKYYKSGDEIIVSAKLTDDEKTTKTYTVNDVPICLNTLDNNQQKYISNEAEKYLNEQLDNYKSTGIFCESTAMKVYSAEVKTVKLTEKGFICLKDEYVQKYIPGNTMAYNTAYFIYTIEAINGNNGKTYEYPVLFLLNYVSQLKDGSICWYADFENSEEKNGIISQFGTTSNLRSYNNGEFNITVFE